MDFNYLLIRFHVLIPGVNMILKKKQSSKSKAPKVNVKKQPIKVANQKKLTPKAKLTPKEINKKNSKTKNEPKSLKAKIVALITKKKVVPKKELAIKENKLKKVEPAKKVQAKAAEKTKKVETAKKTSGKVAEKIKKVETAKKTSGKVVEKTKKVSGKIPEKTKKVELAKKTQGKAADKTKKVEENKKTKDKLLGKSNKIEQSKKVKGKLAKKSDALDDIDPIDDHDDPDLNSALMNDLEKADIDKAIREELVEHLSSLDEDYSLEDLFNSLKGIDFFNGHTGDCLERGCDNPPTTMGYCRLHYIKRWSDIKKKIKILSEGKLQTFIEELVNKYPPKFIESVLDDLKDEKNFFKALKELNIESDDDFDDVALDEIDDDQDIVFETKSTLKTTVFTEED